MRSKPSANRAATALRLAAQGVANSHSALGAYYRRMRARLGAPKAITATAHKLARLVYSITGCTFFSVSTFGIFPVGEGQNGRPWACRQKNAWRTRAARMTTYA